MLRGTRFIKNSAKGTFREYLAKNYNLIAIIKNNSNSKKELVLNLLIELPFKLLISYPLLNKSNLSDFNNL